jgi:hypothetical protein
MGEWEEELKVEKVITAKFKKALRVVKREELFFNKTFLEISSYIYFLFYHDYNFDHENELQKNQLLENTNSNIPLLESLFEEEADIKNVFSGDPFYTDASSNKHKDPKIKHFMFCENNLNSKSMPYALALKGLLKEINPTLENPESTPENPNQESPNIDFLEQEIQVKIHAGLFDSTGNRMDQDVIDIIKGNERHDGKRQYGVGTDVLRLLIAAMDQGGVGYNKLI